MTPTPDDDAFVARLRGAYDRAPAHTQQPLPARVGPSRGRGTARRRVALAAAVAAAVAAVPVTAALLAGAESSDVAGQPSPAPRPVFPDGASEGDTRPSDVLPICRALELEVRLGDDVLLPGDRQGRLVRLATRRDRVCRVDSDVTVSSAVGPRLQARPPVLSSTVARDDGSFVVAPDRDVAFMVSSPRCQDEDRDRGDIARLLLSAGRVGLQVANELGATGSCGGLAVDWVVSEGFDDAGEPYDLRGGIEVTDAFVVGARGRVVATVRNPTADTLTVSQCAFRVLPGESLVVAPPGCDGLVTEISPGGATTLELTQQFMGASFFAGTTFAVTVDGVAAPVRLIEVQPRS